MQIETIISSISQSNAQSGSSSQVAFAPVVDNRQVETFVRVADGTPFIIGGLLSTDQQGRKVGLPLLSEIPLLGSLFSREHFEQGRRGVIVVITPHIVPLEDNSFSYLIPKDSQLFDRFDTQLFRNAYRVRDDEVWDLKFIQESPVLQDLMRRVGQACQEDLMLRQDERVSPLLEGRIPGEEVLVRRMLSDIVGKLEFEDGIDLDKVFFTLGGAEAIENAIKLARHYTGRHKVLARYRAYHGATLGAMTLTGDPRRWANEPGIWGVVRYPDTHRWGEKEPRPVAESLQGLEDVIRYEGPHTIAAVFLETIVGTNGILIPPDGYLQGVREMCDRHGILMVADEVMAGFGRTGRWFAVDHWDVVPDLMTMAKGLTSSYLPLGAVAMRRKIAEKFDTTMFYRGLTYSSHPVSLAAALATIRVYEEDRLIENAARLGPVMRAHHERLYARHPSVGAHRNLGLFGVLDLVRSRDPFTPLTPFNGTSDEMKAIGKYLRDHGLYTMIANNSIHTNPPLSITEDQLAEGFAIIDAALDLADEAVA